MRGVRQLANKLDAAVGGAGRGALPVLVQVNTSGEESKYGVAPGDEAVALARHVARECGHLRLAGLMTIGQPDYSSRPENFTARTRAAATGISASCCHGLASERDGDGRASGRDAGRTLGRSLHAIHDHQSCRHSEIRCMRAEQRAVSTYQCCAGETLQTARSASTPRASARALRAPGQPAAAARLQRAAPSLTRVLTCAQCLRRCRGEVAAALGLPEDDLELSMGMSADYEQAVRARAHLVFP